MRVAAFFIRMQRKPTRAPEKMREKYAERDYPKPARITRALRRCCDVRSEKLQESEIYTLAPKQGAGDRHILYTHGGGFVHALQRAHWNILEQLILETGATVTVPIYPLAPEHDHTAAFTLLEAVYRRLLERVDPARLVLCGDSAGGNLALAQALRYRDRQLPLPGRVILFSPWLELALLNPELAAIEPRDVMQDAAELREYGRWWAGSKDAGDPSLSPINAELRGLPPIAIHQGTDDLFLPDARRFRALAEAAGVRVDLYESIGAIHVFMGATFTREAKATFQKVAEILR